ncbi:MAG: MFS transporter [Coriobacteriia bacterium]|nr:MFS transporter [Coriobacteriia bacterium]MCL2870570.1 MFS transporter [Coriobacteriia bacterium]
MNRELLVSININERWLTVANFAREVGMQAAYHIGVLGYAAFGFGGDATTVMAVMLMLNLSGMVGSIIGGSIVDKIGPRKTVLWASIFVTIICLIAGLTHGNVTAFVIFAAFFGLATTILNTAYTSFAPYLERSKSGLRRVNSFLTIGAFIAVVVGPALGAIVTGRLPVYSVFILMAIVTVAAALIILRVKEKHAPKDDEADDEVSEDDLVFGETEYSHALEFEAEKEAREHGITLTDPVRVTSTSLTAGTAFTGRNASKRRVKKSGPFGEALEGWNIIRKSRNLRYYLMIAVGMVFGFGAFDALEPVYFYQILQVDISMLGWIYAVGGVGLIVGVILLAAFPLKWVNARLLIVLLVICGIGSIAYIATLNLWWVAAGQMVLGFAFGVFDPLLRTMVQADSPLKAVGRVLGTINMFTLGLLLIPLVLAPWLSNLFGVQQVLIVAGALPIVFGLLLYPSGKRVDKDAAADGSRRQIESVSALD